MKKTLLIILLSFTGSFAFAGGSSIGNDGDSISPNSEMNSQTFESKSPRQVILMGADQNEVVFGATDDGVTTRSLRRQIREVQPEVQDALRQSAQSGQWESVNMNRAKLNQLNQKDVMRNLNQPSGY